MVMECPDSFETMFGFDPNDPSDAALDPDNDGLTNLQEFMPVRILRIRTSMVISSVTETR